MKSKIFEKIVAKRGIKDIESFIDPAYESLHNPLKMPDINAAVDRLVSAKKKHETVGIYGDYDIDGLTATTLLHDAFKAFGIKSVPFIPNRFTEGYGMAKSGIDSLRKQSVSLIVTVDCGSRSESEIDYAKQQGIDVIVTDHHEIDEPPHSAIAVINPKRSDSKYPFNDRAGAGVAFALVQAMQTKLSGLDKGQAKWLLDLIAMSTISDVVSLTDENRTLVFYGLKVLKKTRRVGLKALIDLTFENASELDETGVNFRLSPRLNAAGRLKTAEIALKLLMTNNKVEAKQLANELDEFNYQRRQDQAKIFKEATKQAEQYFNDKVLVLSDKNWSHGINGIVAAKIVERYAKPTFVMQELNNGEVKGSARSLKGFSLAKALAASRDLLVSGGGHELAAGATVKKEHLDEFRYRLNKSYNDQKVGDLNAALLPENDIELNTFTGLDLELVEMLNQLSPFGQGNPRPVFLFKDITVRELRSVGSDQTHAKLKLADKNGQIIDAIGFSLSEKFNSHNRPKVNVYAHLSKNEYRGRISLQLEVIDIT